MYNDDQRKSDEQYMQQLYSRFRSEVESGAIVDFYEIDELLDIYDYAQDEGDVMVQMYVFLTAARQYPQNHDFDERMAFFLSYVSQDAAGDMFERKGRRDSALWEVLKMGVDCYPDGDPERPLKTLLKKYVRLDCESLLKIIDLLRDMERLDLLVKYYSELNGRAEDPKGFAFEVAEAIKDCDAFRADARRIAEDVTKLEPFNVEAWLLLARVEFGLEHCEDALAAVDYALAIEPENINARITRGVVLAVTEGKQKESIAILDAVLAEEPANIFALEGLAEAYARIGDNEQAARHYWTIIERGITPASASDPLVNIAALDTVDLPEYLEKFYSMGNNDENAWIERAESIAHKGCMESAARFLDFFQKRQGFMRGVNHYLHLIYAAGMFERYVEVFAAVCSDKQHPASVPGYFSLTDYLMLASVYLRLGHNDEAAQLSEALMHRTGSIDSIDDTLRLRGIKLTAKFINELATQPHPDLDIRNFDPLTSSLGL